MLLLTIVQYLGYFCYIQAFQGNLGSPRHSRAFIRET